MDAVQEEIKGGKAGSEERPPPPVIVLGAEVEIGQEDGGLGAGHDQDDEDEEEKAEHVVGLMRPDAVQNEEKLDEDAAEGQDAAHHDAGQRPRVDRLFGDLTRNLIRPDGMFDRAFLKAEIGADEGQRHGDADPQRQQADLAGTF